MSELKRDDFHPLQHAIQEGCARSVELLLPISRLDLAVETTGGHRFCTLQFALREAGRDAGGPSRKERERVCQALLSSGRFSLPDLLAARPHADPGPESAQTRGQIDALAQALELRGALGVAAPGLDSAEGPGRPRL